MLVLLIEFFLLFLPFRCDDLCASYLRRFHFIWFLAAHNNFLTICFWCLFCIQCVLRWRNLLVSFLSSASKHILLYFHTRNINRWALENVFKKNLYARCMENLMNKFKEKTMIELGVTWNHFELWYFTRLVHLLSHIKTHRKFVHYVLSWLSLHFFCFDIFIRYIFIAFA